MYCFAGGEVITFSDYKFSNMHFDLDFITQYNQFYISDKSSPHNIDSDNFWTDEAFKNRLAVEDGILGIGTECYGHVKGELNILNSKNRVVDFDEYDHIVEASIKIGSGIIQIIDCPNSAVELEVEITPGIYRVRIYASGLKGIYKDEMEEEAGYYKIEIWPGKDFERNVLKEFVYK
jgi:hypothetical protein